MGDGCGGPAMRSEPALRLQVEHRLGSLRLVAALAIDAQWTVIFGPSGSGKSTLLRLIAGLVRPDHGSISVLGRPVIETTRGLWVPAYQRPVRWAGQREALFPHMTARENIACGLGGHAEDLERVLQLFGLHAWADQMPAKLSGGQRQRVAVARAAAGARGKLLLLDEPFTGLDAVVRAELIAALREWLGTTPVISVTHDVGEAYLLNAEIVRMAEGQVLAQGPVKEVLAAERAALQRVLGTGQER